MSTPKIRFKGFEDDWEQRKLGDVCSRVQGNDGRMELPTLTISAGNGWMRQEDRFSGNIAGKEQKNYTLLRKGELSYNHGNSKLAKYGTVFSLQTYEEALVPRVYHSFKVKEGNCDFVEYYFATKLPDRELSKLISSGARMDGLLNIGYDEFMGIQMKFPSTLEQRKISLYFRKLDHLITLHQRKCDETKQLKKFMLQKMFPKNGEKNPEIRFEGFTDAWEQRKLGALMEDGIILEQSDGNHGELYPRSKEFVNEGIPYIAASSISSDGERIDFNLTKYLSMERAIQFRKGVAKNGDVLLAHNATVGPSVMLSMDYEFAILSTSLTLYRLDKEKMSPMFFLQAIRSGYFQKQLEVFMKQTTRSQVPILTQRNLQISYPINKVEQERIGEFLSNLDHLITLHQRKCEKLKELKKYMLQNMFV